MSVFDTWYEYQCLDCGDTVSRTEGGDCDGDVELHEWLWCDDCCGGLDREE